MTKKFIYVADIPILLEEWHPTRNGNLLPAHVVVGSAKKVWWKCSEGGDHQWRTTISSRTARTRKSTGCPFCSNRRVSKTNNLAFLHPGLAKEWHPTKNGDLFPKDVVAGSAKKVWWKCPEGDDHEWERPIEQRSNGSMGCPFCSGYKVGQDNNLAFLQPQIAEQWHPTRNGTLSPNVVFVRSIKKVWWKCPEGDDHEWRATVKHRTEREQGCPFCVGKRVSKTNNLAFLHPDLAKEWHPTRNGDLSPEDVTAGKSKRVWWKCPRGDDHEWKTSIANRARAGTGCPSCTNQTSMAEIRVFTELMYVFPEALSRYKFKKKELDIYLQSLKLGVEYDGRYFHAGKESSDRKKNSFFADSGIEILRLRELPLKKVGRFDILLIKDSLAKSHINSIMRWIEARVDTGFREKIRRYIKEENFVNEQSFREYASYFPDPFPENSLRNVHPQLCQEWNLEKNYPLVPENFSHQSNKSVWWKCKIDPTHEWRSTINNRASGKSCPYCRNFKTSEKNNLAFLHPEIAKEWHPTRNGIFASKDVVAGSHKKVWWKCPKGDDHEWETAVEKRTNSGTGCPFCANRRVSKANNLAFLYPGLAKEWHPTKNGDLSPKDVVAGGFKKAWWKCPEGDDHQWRTTISSRTARTRKSTGCPFCSNRRVSRTNNLAFLHPGLAKEWHPTKNGDLFPKDVVAGSAKKVWWKCPKGGDHEWETGVEQRSNGGKGCPFCLGQK